MNQTSSSCQPVILPEKLPRIVPADSPAPAKDTHHMHKALSATGSRHA
ncbi:hypothetical protein [Pseudarthrobacter sp. S9]